MMNGIRSAWATASLRMIVDAFEHIPGIEDSTMRDDLVESVRDALQTHESEKRLAVGRHHEKRRDLVAIVKAVLGIPGGLLALRETIRTWFGDSADDVVELLHQCARASETEPSPLADGVRASLFGKLHGIGFGSAVDIPKLFTEATKPLAEQTSKATLGGVVALLERRATLVYLFRFLELVAAHSVESDPRESLHAWIDEHIELVPEHRRGEVTSLRRSLNGQAVGADVRTCLLVRIDPIEDGLYSVMAWLGQTDAELGPNCGPEEPVDLPDLRQWLAGLIKQYRNGALDPNRHPSPSIEFVLPSSHFHLDVDAWMIDGERLGAVYQVAVRPMRRSDSGRRLLAERWRILQGSAAKETALKSVRWLHATMPPLVPAENQAWAWIGITCPQMAADAGTVDAVLDTGTPVGAWLRGDQTPEVRRELLEKLGHPRAVTDLPDAVWRFREWGWRNNDDRRHLVLLWDDPDRPPPQDHLVAAPNTGD